MTIKTTVQSEIKRSDSTI